MSVCVCLCLFVSVFVSVASVFFAPFPTVSLSQKTLANLDCLALYERLRLSVSLQRLTLFEHVLVRPGQPLYTSKNTRDRLKNNSSRFRTAIKSPIRSPQVDTASAAAISCTILLHTKVTLTDDLGDNPAAESWWCLAKSNKSLADKEPRVSQHKEPGTRCVDLVRNQAQSPRGGGSACQARHDLGGGKDETRW